MSLGAILMTDKQAWTLALLLILSPASKKNVSRQTRQIGGYQLGCDVQPLAFCP